MIKVEDRTKKSQTAFKRALKILFFGDIVGKTGRLALALKIKDFEKQYLPDFVIANGENASSGLGIVPRAYNYLRQIGIDAITLGDHFLDKSQIEPILDDPSEPIIRPLNYPKTENAELSGRSYFILERSGKKLAIINLQGRVFMKEGLDNPFNEISDLLKKEKALIGASILVDFHAEATSEKEAMGWHLDGRVSAVVGTHTHVQTNDAKILPSGTGYISDAGMCGAENSILGDEKSGILPAFLQGRRHKVAVADFPAKINGVYLEINPQTNKCEKIEAVRVDGIEHGE